MSLIYEIHDHASVIMARKQSCIVFKPKQIQLLGKFLRNYLITRLNSSSPKAMEAVESFKQFINETSPEFYTQLCYGIFSSSDQFSLTFKYVDDNQPLQIDILVPERALVELFLENRGLAITPAQVEKPKNPKLQSSVFVAVNHEENPTHIPKPNVLRYPK